jgi:hypothetical protein
MLQVCKKIKQNKLNYYQHQIFNNNYNSLIKKKYKIIKK